MKNSIKNLATVVFVAFITFSFTSVEGDRKEVKTEKSPTTKEKETTKKQLFIQ